MFEKFKGLISRTFLGEPVAETREVFRSLDSKFRIHAGLFRKGAVETVWLKFVHRGLIGSSSTGLGVRFDRFADFSGLLDRAIANCRAQSGEAGTIPLFPRVCLRLTEGVRDLKFLAGVQPEPGKHPKAATNFYSFVNRNDRIRVIFEHAGAGEATYEAFDPDGLQRLRDFMAPHAE